jgi:hypothetical protein
VRFERTGETLRLIRPDGRPFETYQAIMRRADDAERRADDAERRADDAERRAEAERRRVERLVEQLRARGIDPDAG